MSIKYIQIAEVDLDRMRSEIKELTNDYNYVKFHYSRLEKERDALVKRLRVAGDMLLVCHDAIKSLPIEALGDSEFDCNGEPYKYPIRDEIIDKINHTLAEIEKGATKMSEELKLCPFCGKPFEIQEIYNGNIFVKHNWGCLMSNAFHTSYGFTDKQRVIEEINTRPLEDALAAECDELKGQRDELIRHFNDNADAYCKLEAERDELLIELEEAQASTEFQAKRADVLVKEIKALNTMHDIAIAERSAAWKKLELARGAMIEVRSQISSLNHKAAAILDDALAEITKPDGDITKKDGEK